MRVRTDCFAEFSKAVLLSYAAVEALVNEMIESLDENVTITHSNAKGIEAELKKAEIVRRMSTAEKLDRAIPHVTNEPSIKGTIFWEKFVCLRRIRDALVHVKEGGYSNDADNPSEYGMLLRGDADDCVLDACALVEKLYPECLSEAARRQLKIASIGANIRLPSYSSANAQPLSILALKSCVSYRHDAIMSTCAVRQS